jgi:hypothetical protein
MNLHLDGKMFDTIITQMQNELSIHRSIIIKDYFVTLFLKTLKDYYPQYIFKGGTSLSKCFYAINRFSEDIDLSYYITAHENITSRKIKKANKGIKEAINHLGFIFKNEEEFKSGRKFQIFEAEFSFKEEESVVRDHIIIENSILTISFPVIEKNIESMIGSYLKEMDMNNLADDYELHAFSVKAQDISRTFIDKVYAICDYYLEDKAYEHSRHIYDLHMLYNKIGSLDDSTELIQDVREERKNNIKSISILEEKNIKNLLQEIIVKNFYKLDYENITKKLVYDDTSYSQAIETLKLIAAHDCF